MKKFLSLLCALSTIVSASADQLAPAKFVSAKKAQTVSLNKNDKAVAQKTVTVLNKTAKSTKMVLPSMDVIHKVTQAPKAKTETIALTFDNSNEPSFEYYAADGDWYLGWPDVTNTYIVRLDYVVGLEGKFGSYTITDLDLDYSFLSDYSSGARVDVSYTAAEFTIKDEGNDAWSLSGSITCDNGNTYTLNGYYEAPKGETYNVELTKLVSAYYYDFDMDYYFKVANSDYTFVLDLVSESGMFAGEYTTEDAILNYCSVTGPAGNENIKELEISIVSASEAAAQEVPKYFELTGCVITEKGNTYNIHLLLKEPLTPKSIVNAQVECVDFEWPNCDYPGIDGMFIFADTDVPSRAFQVAIEKPLGEFTVEDGIAKEYTGMVDYSTLMPYMIDNGTITATLNGETRVLTLAVEMVCADTIQYNFTCDIPVEIDAIEITLNDLEFNDLRDNPEYGGWQISGYDADSTIWASVVVNSETIEGSYTMEDVMKFIDYNDIQFMDASGKVIEDAVLSCLSKNIQVTIEPVTGSDDIIVHVESEGIYGTRFAKLHLSSAPYNPNAGDKNDMQENIEKSYATEDIDLFQVDPEEGYAYLRAQKGNEMFAVLIYILDDQLWEGTYQFNDSFEPGSVQPGMIEGNNVYPTFWATTDEEGYLNLPLFMFAGGTVEVSYDAEENIQLDVNATNTWGNTAHITVNKSNTGIENVAVKDLKSGKMLKNGNIVIKKNDVEYNAFGVKL